MLMYKKFLTQKPSEQDKENKEIVDID